MYYIEDYMRDVEDFALQLRTNPKFHEKIEKLVDRLLKVRAEGGRVFILGIGGSAANASHMVNDLRKICEIDALAPTDNISELTARVNDEEHGWENYFWKYLSISNFSEKDIIFILSVSGCVLGKNVTSYSLVKASCFAGSSQSYGILGRDDGEVYKVSPDNMIVVPSNLNGKLLFAHGEEFQGIIWHMIVNHPHLKI